ncbi:uncharacterized protein LOC121366397 [Gigantopelta aegis]|uniref:uncharacterized protein LOC121366397 n=1 Tax=Gigantopelta aegis TaxID=1735272 RepID=UPI001B88BF33|nr:uncharacterized protein LOC121366397 [Gigantopelta aegis]
MAADVQWIVRLLVGIIGGVFPLLSAESGDLEIIDNVSWGDAFRQCGARGRRLYTATDPDPRQNVRPGSYWVGAKVQYSSWMWTENNEPLFPYIGQVNASLIASSTNKIYNIPYDNQASRCFYQCRTNTQKYIGMQGSRCYCFKTLDGLSVEADSETGQDGCWGNFREYCGSNETVSIYHTELFTSYVIWKLNRMGSCGYIVYKSSSIIVKSDTDCTKTKGRVCNCK